MKNSFHPLTIIIAIGLMLIACNKSSDDSESELIISELDLWVGHIQTTSDLQYYLNPVLTTEIEHPFHSDSLGLNIFISNYSLIPKKAKSSNGSSTDLKIAPIQINSKYVPALISIYSDSLITSDGISYIPGENLSSLFEAYHSNKSWLPVLKMLEDFGVWYKDDSILLRFIKAPDHALNQKLTVKVILENGDEFLLETPIIKTE